MSQLTFLNEREHGTLRAINDVLYPPGGAIPYGANEVGACEYVDDYLYNMKPKQQRMIRLLLLFLEWAPIVLLRATRRFSRLALDERRRFLEGLENSRLYFLRIVLISIRTIVGMAFLADERVLASIGYFAECPYPGDKKKYLTAKEVPGALNVIPKEVRHAD